MAYNELLAQRVRGHMESLPGFIEKKMFGGVGFMLFGNIACGVNKDDLIVRVGPAGYDDALSQPNVRVFDLTGRPMKGWVVVTAGGYESDQELWSWIEKGIAFARSLPVK
ncbi:MAG: RNA methyltransferase [Anaerolineales bacterium]|nr:RNA methyltransferase [Anaerolineales bacterium]